MRGLEILQNMGFDIRILQLEGAKDPDEFIIKYGSGKFNLFIQNAISLVEFKVKNLKENLDLNQTNDKIKFLNEVSEILSKTKNDIEKEVYIDKISRNYNISKEAIYAELNKIAYANSSSSKVLDRSKVVKKTEGNIKKENQNSDTARENLLILLLINEGQEVYEKVKNEITPSDFKDEKNKKIAKVLYEELEKGDISNIIGLFNDDEELVSHITYILSKELDISDVDKAVNDLINKFLTTKLLEEKNLILKQLVSGNLDKEQTQKIEKRLNEISMKIASIK